MVGVMGEMKFRRGRGKKKIKGNFVILVDDDLSMDRLILNLKK